MRYVVTGAAGFIGSHLARSLQEAGHEVVGIDCFTDYYDPAEKEASAQGLDVRRVDLAEQPLDLDGVDGVFHLAAQAGVRSFGDVFPTYVRRNLLASQRVFEACAPYLDGERPAPRTITFSTDGADLKRGYGGPPAVILGPGEPRLAHQTDEWCSLARIEQSTELFRTLMQDWQGDRPKSVF